MKIKKAVIPAAGLGTRFLPATKSQPKEMLPCCLGMKKNNSAGIQAVKTMKVWRR
ncbi:UTP--glucose-1-phosphate uridylyltransferase [Pelotomaculum propionicicum]|uniref:UTP--glucose-1-phosphate uridylyltransferase n=1 Tax=Pelotomaculum propionicicum TaxID=258475 RepID=A0A4Y7RYE0_9FIRM|nr:UTP--glucose-1-phosphate uridylyltransferase [Pelotomaculum propionicicum]